jgi:foldase protein PrsA
MRQNKSATYRFIRASFMVVLALFIISGCGGEKADKKKAAGDKPVKDANIVAVYEGGQVSRDELDNFLAITLFFYPQYGQFKGDPSFQESILNQLITFKILYDRVDEQKIKESQPRVEEQLAQFKQMFELQSGAKLKDKLKEANLTEQDIQRYIELSMVVMSDVENNVTDEEVQAEYDETLKENKGAFTTATVSHILIATEDFQTGKALRTKEEALARAKEVQQKLANGADFAQLAQEYSDDEGSKNNGGTYADADVNMWVPEFKKAALDLPLNTVSEPVETQFGYHVMRVESRDTKSFEDVKTVLKSELAGEKISDFVEKELPGLIKEVNLPKPEQPTEQPAEDK